MTCSVPSDHESNIANIFRHAMIQTPIYNIYIATLLLQVNVSVASACSKECMHI